MNSILSMRKSAEKPWDLRFSGWCSPIFFSDLGHFSSDLGWFLFPMFYSGATAHRGDVYSGAQCVKLLLRISVEPADDRDPWRRDRFLLKTTRNDREMILEIGKA